MAKFPDSTEDGERKRNMFLLISTVILFLGVLGLAFYAYQTGAENTKLSRQNIQLEQEKEVFERTLKAKEAELIAKLGESREKDSLITIYLNEIEELKAEIAKLKKEKATADLYRRKFLELKNLEDKYLSEIDQLKKENKELKEENVDLTVKLEEEEKTSEQLKEENKEMAKLLEEGKLVGVLNIRGEGQKHNFWGKLKETDKANQIERLKICFDVAGNKLADKGEKRYLVAMKGPDDKILFSQEAGSGETTLADSATVIKFSKKKALFYEQMPATACLYWDESSSYLPGKYTIQVYQDGYLVGENKFYLK